MAHDMPQPTIRGVCQVALLLVFTLTGLRAVDAQPSAESLAELAKPLFTVGVGVDMEDVRRPPDIELLTRHFNSVTPEWSMKQPAVQPAEGQFDFDAADRFVEFARQRNLEIVGHCLVWASDERTPEWFFKDGEGTASAEMVLSRMENHIKTVAGRYRGQIAMWDVVNEALADGADGYLRDSGWTRATGEEFLVRAFEAARAADPDALLIYNDYRCDTQDKRKKLLRLVEMFKARHVPVDAIGFQAHYELDSVPYEGLEEMLQTLRRLGFKVVFSELDIDVVTRSRWWADDGKHREELASYDPYKDGSPPEVLARQAEQYAQLFRLFVEYDDIVERVTFWNLHDGQSWLNSFPWRRVNHPLLFDRQRQPKPAFEAVAEVLANAER